MNYYEHHIRDYDAATNHLTWDQDLAYTRLIRWYYRKEMPVPADIAEACRQIRAVGKAQRQAVEAVLKEFFELRDDGWHQQTCDETLAAFHAGEPERELRKNNEELRVKRHRDERAQLFKKLNEAGHHAHWNIGIKELRELVARVVVVEPETKKHETVTPPVTAPVTPATATQAPDTNHQSPITNLETSTPTPATSAGGVSDRFEAKRWLIEKGVPDQLATDWLKVRKAKRLAPTQTAFEDIEGEAQKAGITFVQAIEKACRNSWAGFKASWEEGAMPPKGGKQSRHAGFENINYREGVGEDGRF